MRRRTTRLRRGLGAAVLALAVASSATALAETNGSGAASNAAGWKALAAPGAIAIMRHARAPGTGDPAETVIVEDCTTQRNLDAAGRAQAAAIGKAIRARGIAFDTVLAGAWCRVRDTAVLMDVGAVQHFAPLDDVYHRLDERDARTAALRAYLADVPDDERVLLVTHQLNITGLTGLPAYPGEILVLDVAEDGTARVEGHIRIPADPKDE